MTTLVHHALTLEDIFIHTHASVPVYIHACILLKILPWIKYVYICKFCNDVIHEGCDSVSNGLRPL